MMQRPCDFFNENYLDALLAGMDGTRKELPKIAQASEAVAERLVAGGELFIASVRPDFVSEGIVRAGGLMLLKAYTAAVALSEKDTIIFGWSNTTPQADLGLLRSLHKTGAFVLGIGPIPVQEVADEFLSHVDVFLQSSLPLPSTVTTRFRGESYPLISLQNLVVLWTFTGEVVAALTRQGFMAAMYQSVCVPQARERNAKFHHHRFHETHAVGPIPPEQLGRTYLEKLNECLSAVREQEIAAIEAVAQVCTSVRKAGHHIYASLVSHFPVHQLSAPGDPTFMQRLEHISGETPSAAELAEKLQPGDLFFFLGYYRRPVEAYETARRAGARIVEVIAGTDTPPPRYPQPNHVIRPKWPYGDALVVVPNYDIKILPGSGIVQAAIYWAVVGLMSA